MKKLAMIVVLVCLVASMTLFAAGQQEAAKEAEGFKVAYMTPALHIPFWKDIADGIRDEAAKVPNVTIINSDSKLSAATQFQNAQDLIVSGIDAIIISPTDSASCPAVLELAAENKVPVFICDIGTDSGPYSRRLFLEGCEGTWNHRG